MMIKGGNSGSAYIFTNNGGTWNQIQKLTADDGDDNDFFGRSVAISCNTVIIGANQDDDKGSAYIFDGLNEQYKKCISNSCCDNKCDNKCNTQCVINTDIEYDVILYPDETAEVKFIHEIEYSYDNYNTMKLTADDGAEGDRFGWSVAISGNNAIVGAYRDDDKGDNSGSAYIFTNNGGTWAQTQKLTADDGDDNDFFGRSVAISGNTAIVGAYLDDDKGSASGSAYIFTNNGGTWSQTEKLTADDGAEGDQFGWSVAISCNTAIVGAYLDDDKGSASGSAYIFTNNGGTWIQTQKLTASDGAMDDEFGRSVAISCNTAIVGANLDDDKGSASGSAYIFTNNGGTWIQTQKLTADDGEEGDQFGTSVAISGNTAIVGANLDDDKGSNSGSVYIFTNNGGTWIQTQKLTASDGDEFDQFGTSVAISGNTAIVGANLDDDKGQDSGSAYIFTNNGGTWSQTEKLIAFDGDNNDEFGRSVAIGSYGSIVGAPNNSSNGSVYSYIPVGCVDSKLQIKKKDPCGMKGMTGPQGPSGIIGPFRGVTGPTGPINSGTLFWNSGSGEIVANTAKSFIIEHPIDKEKYLVHACLEGPESGVYYRGEAEIKEDNSNVEISLPNYVDELATNFTVHITPIYNGKHNLISASRVKNNKFTVYGDTGEFSWIVYGKRSTVNVEPYKNEVDVQGKGPYKWIE